MVSVKPMFYAGFVLLFAHSLSGCRTATNASVTASSSESSGASADKTDNPQIARFTVWLDALDKSIDGRSAEDAAEKLTDGTARNGVFNLQALGRLYEDEDSTFKKARKKFKSLEDGIGAYAKWEELLQKANDSGASSAVKEKHEKNMVKAKKALVKLLDEEDFIPSNSSKKPYLKTLRSFLNSYNWKSTSDDRKFMVKALTKQLEEIKSSKYDFSHLEDGNGVHEFRRKLRWFAMEARALNGMVVLDADASCPVPEYAKLLKKEIAASKYAVLPPSSIEKNPVKLTPCLYVKIAKEIEDVGELKGAVEEADNNTTAAEASDAVSAKDQAEVSGILKEMLKNDVFGRLQDDLKGK